MRGIETLGYPSRYEATVNLYARGISVEKIANLVGCSQAQVRNNIARSHKRRRTYTLHIHLNDPDLSRRVRKIAALSKVSPRQAVIELICEAIDNRMLLRIS